jgi:hypothetical protein
MQICSETVNYLFCLCKLISNQLMEKAQFLCLLTNQLKLFYFFPALENCSYELITKAPFFCSEAGVLKKLPA